jgi:hypothetical protein
MAGKETYTKLEAYKARLSWLPNADFVRLDFKPPLKPKHYSKLIDTKVPPKKIVNEAGTRIRTLIFEASQFGESLDEQRNMIKEYFEWRGERIGGIAIKEAKEVTTQMVAEESRLPDDLPDVYGHKPNDSSRDPFYWSDQKLREQMPNHYPFEV